jgi:hypothetical protein
MKYTPPAEKAKRITKLRKYNPNLALKIFGWYSFS